MVNNYQPAHCATCNKEIFPHWKYCQEHTKNNIILDMDVNPKKIGVTLCKQENDRVWKLLEAEMKDHGDLKEQYAKLQDDFHELYRDGFEKYTARILGKKYSKLIPKVIPSVGISK